MKKDPNEKPVSESLCELSELSARRGFKGVCVNVGCVCVLLLVIVSDLDC